MSFGDAVRKAMDSELIEPPKGQYKVKLDEASAFESKDGREFAKVILQITEGDFAGERFQHFMGFANDIARQVNGEALAAYGVNMTEVNEVTDLDDQLDALVKTGTTAEVGVSYKDGWVNIKVHGSRTPGASDIPTTDAPAAAPSFAAAAGAKNDDTIPF